MMNLSAFASNLGNVLNSIDSAAKETFEDIPKVSATRIRRQNAENNSSSSGDIAGKEFFENDDVLEVHSNATIENVSTHSNKSNSGSSLNFGIAEYSTGTPEKSASSGAFNISKAVAPPSSNSKMIVLATASDIDAETKKALKKNKNEIERLNSECLELENQCDSLKAEVREAWDNYKQAQEKAALVESDLQEEARQAHKAKAAEKQASVAQIVKLNEELAISAKQLIAVQTEKEDLVAQLTAANEVTSEWAAQVTRLNEELAVARDSTVQGVQGLREQFDAAQKAAEQSRHDHNAVIRQSQLRLSQLENENNELTRSLAIAQKEIHAFKNGGETSNGNTASSAPIDYLSRDYFTMQQEVLRLSAALETAQESLLDSERRARQLECEARATSLNMDDERRRHAAAVQSQSSTIAALEDKLRDLKRSSEASQHRAAGGGVGGVFSAALGQYEAGDGITTNSGSGEHGESTVGDAVQWRRLEAELSESRGQAQNLSKLLLKKQGLVVELQAERAALKSRLTDSEARCAKAVQSLSGARRDLEGGVYERDDDDADYDNSEGSNSLALNNNNNGLQRRSAGALGGSGNNEKDLNVGPTRVISDLEKIGVKPGARVVRAVNMIDSWANLSGRFLRSYPLARLGFVLYLLVLHVWVLFVLVLHMETLQMQMDAEEQKQQLLHP